MDLYNRRRALRVQTKQTQSTRRSQTPAPQAGTGGAIAEPGRAPCVSGDRRPESLEDLVVVVGRATKGDRAAASELFDRYYPRVHRYALAKLRDPSNAEDVAAETFSRVVRELRRFKWKGAGFEAWLFRIASNVIVDQARRAGREAALGDASDNVEVPGGRTPEDAVLMNELTDELNGILAQLPPDQQEVLILRCAAQLSTEEICRTMGRSANAVRQLQFRALENMRARMLQPAGGCRRERRSRARSPPKRARSSRPRPRAHSARCSCR